MNTLDLLKQIQRAFPQAIGFITLNEGQGTEVYGENGKLLATLPNDTFNLLFERGVYAES